MCDKDHQPLDVFKANKLKVQHLRKVIDKITVLMEALCGSLIYSELTKADQVKYDLFLAYSLNSLYWMYLRTKCLDPNEETIKKEIDRVRDCMTRSKKIHDRKTIMPHLNKQVAQRFIRSGLWSPDNHSVVLWTEENANSSISEVPQAECQLKRKLGNDGSKTMCNKKVKTKS